MLSRFRSCLFGALAGDCLGAQFEGIVPCTEEEWVKHNHLICRFIGCSQDEYKGDKGTEYTDDTALARDVGTSLIENHGFNPRDMIERMAKTYFEQKYRGFGGNVGTVFSLIRRGVQDVFEPAREQFEGRGSYGNGGAMRVAPAALFFAYDGLKCMQLAANQCLLTHTHPDAISGSILIAEAIRWALHADRSLAFSVNQERFYNQMYLVAGDVICEILEPYHLNVTYKKEDYLEKIMKWPSLVNKSQSEIAASLGNGVAAVDSVPAALFAFYASLSDSVLFVSQIKNPILKVIALAISLGGDTDTIATMAAAIAGAFWGDEFVPEYWISRMEGALFYQSMAGKLFDHYNHQTKNFDDATVVLIKTEYSETNLQSS